MVRRATSPDGSKVERRRSPRFPVNVPIEASWRGPDGQVIKQPAVARQVNSHGGMLEMSEYPEMGSRISLLNVLSAETAEARVLATPSSREGVAHGIVVELVASSEGFWGVNLQLKKASVELKKLEEFLQSQGIDLRLLKEYRDTVDYFRLIANIAQQLRKRQLQGQDAEEALVLLADGRIDRITNLCAELIADLDAGRVNSQTKNVEALHRSLDQARQRLRKILEVRQPEGFPAGRP